MDKNLRDLIAEVKKKKEFSQLPDSLIERALFLSKESVKEARALLRKYFGVFLTNKVFKLNNEEILKKHISSKDRDYKEFYAKIFENQKNFKSVIDIGCGVNGFSYFYLKEILGEVNYFGIEAVGQLVEKTNIYFKEKNFSKTKVFHLDVFNFLEVEKILKNSQSPRVFFLFQIIDAMEAFERDFSKKLLGLIKSSMEKNDLIVLSIPLRSLSKKKTFEAKRTWLKNFLEENFIVEKFCLRNERIFRCRKQ